MNYLSDDTLETRLKRVYALRAADKERFHQNPAGEGYLTRDERWQHVLDALEREFVTRSMTRGLRMVAGND